MPMSPSNRQAGTLDLFGAGIGPFNLSLAALAATRAPELTCRFVDAKAGFSWHPGMLLPGTTLQVPFLADLVTMADASNRLSFLSYLQAQDRLYPFYFYESFHIPRVEYDDYCRWAAEQLPACEFGRRVARVSGDPGSDALSIHIEATGNGEKQETVKARHLAVGVGTKPAVPSWAADLPSDRAWHTADHALRTKQVGAHERVVLVGSGQSAAECFLDLLGRVDTSGSGRGEIIWCTQSAALLPMEYTKMGLSHFFAPGYVDLFHGLPAARRQQLLEQQGLLYKGISAYTLNEIYDRLYERSAARAAMRIEIRPMTRLSQTVAAGERIVAQLSHTELDQQEDVPCDRLVFGTGYKAADYSLLSDLSLARNSHGDLEVSRDYQLAWQNGAPAPIFLQNAEMSTHGVGTPDLGLGAYRSAAILNQVAGRSVCRMPPAQVFTRYGGLAPAAPDARSTLTPKNTETNQ